LYDDLPARGGFRSGGGSSLTVQADGRKRLLSTPPTFLFHTNEDEGVPLKNSVRFYLALRTAGVPAELHIFQKGQHGVGRAPEDRGLRTWPELLFVWMEGLGLFAK
jgi:acetyl esterase/lipase